MAHSDTSWPAVDRGGFAISRAVGQIILSEKIRDIICFSLGALFTSEDQRRWIIAWRKCE